MTRAFLIHLFFMILGYAAAVIVATLTVTLLMGLPTIFPDEGAWGSFYRYLRDFWSILAIGAIMTAAHGLPGWLISVITAELRNERGKIWFAIAGFLTAILAYLLSKGLTNVLSTVNDSFVAVYIPIGGIFGGLAYWAVAGKYSGSWRVITFASKES